MTTGVSSVGGGVGGAGGGLGAPHEAITPEATKDATSDAMKHTTSEDRRFTTLDSIRGGPIVSRACHGRFTDVVMLWVPNALSSAITFFVQSGQIPWVNCASVRALR